MKNLFQIIKNVRREIHETHLVVSRLELEVNSLLKTDKMFDYSWMKDGLRIAHAFGEYKGLIMTHSKEAFLQNYKRGVRVFEADIILNSDCIPIVAHDRKTLQRIQNECFLETLTLVELVMLAEKYDDAYFIISVKSRNYYYDNEVKCIFSVLRAAVKTDSCWKRFIPQAYSIPYYNMMLKDFNFESIIYSPRDNSLTAFELINFLDKNGIKAVLLLELYRNMELISALNNAGIEIIAATINEESEWEKLRKEGVKAIISDFLLGGKL